MALNYNKVREKAARCFVDVTLTAARPADADRFDCRNSMFSELCSKLRLDAAERNNLLVTFNQLPSGGLTVAQISEFITRVVANKDYLKEMEIPKWDGTPITTDIHVLGVSREAPSKSGKRLRLYCRALTDLPAGIEFDISMSENMIYYLFSKQLGLGRKNKAEYTEIGGMFFRAVIEHFASGMEISNITATQSMKICNKALQRKREDAFCKTAPSCGLCKKTFGECALSPFYPNKKG